VASLSARPWPGNVRELENAVARIVALSDGGTLDVDALAALDLDAPPAPAASASLRDQVDGFERALLTRVLGECAPVVLALGAPGLGGVTAAASLLALAVALTLAGRATQG
jgi:DNA-binding NtrC family response regulator